MAAGGNVLNRGALIQIEDPGENKRSKNSVAGYREGTVYAKAYNGLERKAKGNRFVAEGSSLVFLTEGCKPIRGGAGRKLNCQVLVLRWTLN